MALSQQTNRPDVWGKIQETLLKLVGRCNTALEFCKGGVEQKL